jgi:hypothetical protein
MSDNEGNNLLIEFASNILKILITILAGYMVWDFLNPGGFWEFILFILLWGALTRLFFSIIAIILLLLVTITRK